MEFTVRGQFVATDIDDALRVLAIYFVTRVLDPDAMQTFGMREVHVEPKDANNGR